jgi:hypothetical protein
MIGLIIKGDMNDAFDAADTHNVELTSLAYVTGSQETLASAPDHCVNAIARWYCEDIGAAPFPKGTLLHYSLDKRDE